LAPNEGEPSQKRGRAILPKTWAEKRNAMILLLGKKG